MKKSILIGLVLGLLTISTFVQAQTEQGILEGKVTIGPICPVETEGTPCETPPEVYEARKIVIYTQDKTSTVAVVDIDENGNYSVALDAGLYVVDINYVGADFSKDVPKEIEIKAGETTKLDILIDTGVRGETQPSGANRTQSKIERMPSELIAGIIIALVAIVLFAVWKTRR